MNWPPSRELAESVALGQAALANAATGHLLLGARQWIWDAMGQVWHMDEYAIVTEGLQRRTHLATLCVRLVLPLWERRQPNNHEPHNLLATIDRYLGGDATAQDINSQRDSLYELTETPEYSGPESCVGLALCQAALTATYDERFDPAAIDPYASDADPALDCYDWDASFWAAAAYSGGNLFSCTQTADSDRLRQFWAWYLDVAVPAACGCYPAGPLPTLDSPQ